MVYKVEFTIEQEHNGWFYYADDPAEVCEIVTRFHDEHELEYDVIYTGTRITNDNERTLYFSLRKHKCEPERKKLFCTTIKVPDKLAISKDKEYYSGIFDDYYKSKEAAQKVIQYLCDKFGYDRFELKCYTERFYLNEEINYEACKKGDQ